MLNSNVESTADLISIALATERESISRYAELATRMKDYGNSEVGVLFERMSTEEQAREQQLTEWAALAGLTLKTDIGPIPWEEDPGVATIYDAEAEDPTLSTPYKALAFAVHNKQRGFRFYSYVAADSKNPEVSDYAEILAREELGQAALLRGQRRRAWHVQRNQQAIEPGINPAAVDNAADLMAVTVCIEQIFARLMDVAGAEFSDIGKLAIDRRDLLIVLEKSLRESPSTNAELHQLLQTFTGWHERALAEIQDGQEALQRLCALCDTSFAFYDSVVTLTRDESVMLMAQSQTEQALELMAHLRRIESLHKLGPSRPG
jgi:rubrerythrin